MKFFYKIAVLAQIGIAFFERDKNKMAYMLYLWKNLLAHEVQGGRPSMRPAGVSKPKETKSHAGDTEYSLFLER